DGGEAAERFARLIERQGGDARVVEEPGRLPSAPVRRQLEAPDSGWFVRLAAREVGLAAVELGAGRTRVDQSVDPAVGFEIHKAVGERVEAGEPLVTVHAASEEDAGGALARLTSALELAEEAPPARPLVRYRVTREGVTALTA
ncbi:MAG: hypothetical protein V3S91_05295, partial [Gemmatimonadota bacterium]